MRIPLLCALVIAVSCVGPGASAGTPPAPTPEPTPEATATPTPAPTVEVVVVTPTEPPASPSARAALVLDATVPARIASFIKASGGGAALVVADSAVGTILHEVEADEVVFAASLYKLGVLLEAEHRIDRGTLRSTDLVTITRADQRDGGSFTPAGTVLTIEQALEKMITVSDNASGLALMRTFGVDAIHATLAREGIKGQAFTPQGSVTTARAVGTLLGEMARGSLVSPAASQRMLSRLSRQRVVDRIPAALPPGVVLGNKTGNLGFVTHDAGLIRGPGGTPVVLVVLTWGSTEAAGSQLIREIAAAVYAGLSRP